MLRDLLRVRDLLGLLGLGIIDDPGPPSYAGMPIGGLGLDYIQARPRDVPRLEDRSSVDPAAGRRDNVVPCDLPKARWREKALSTIAAIVPENGRLFVGILWVRQERGRFDNLP